MKDSQDTLKTTADDSNSTQELRHALQRSEAVFKKVFHCAPVPMTISTLEDGRVIDVNQAFLDQTGFNKEQILDRSSVEFGFIEANERQKVVDAFNAVGKAENIEAEVFDAYGNKIDVLYSGYIIDIDGNTRMLSTAINITEKKRADAEREMTLELLHLINSPIGGQNLLTEAIHLIRRWTGCDAVGIRLERAGDFPYEETCGFSEAFVGKGNTLSRNNRVPSSGDQGPQLSCICGATLQGRLDTNLKSTTEHGTFWTNSLTQWLEDTPPAGKPPLIRYDCKNEGYESLVLIPLKHRKKTFGLLHIADKRRDYFTRLDIARLEQLASNLSIGLSQRLTTSALKESEERLSLAFEGARADSWEIDLLRRIVSSSRQWVTYLGYNHAGPLPIDLVMSYIHPHDRKRSKASLLAHLTGKVDRFESESRFRKSDGSYIWVLSRGKVVEWDKRDRPKRLVGINFDISDLKQSEAERAKLQVELEQKHKMESVGRLAGGVAHDFNNMLGVILGHVDLSLREASSNAAIYDHLIQIRTAAERSADLTRQLLAFARKQPVDPKVLDINETITGTLQMIARLIGEEITLRFNPGHLVWPVKMDPSQVDQILTNLCINARDAITGTGNIVIETDNITLEKRPPNLPEGSYVLLTVTDDGRGMDEETRKYLFEPFFTTKDIGKGTGLGLAMVYGIVAQNRGFIEVDSKPQRGTTFKIHLPRHIGVAKTCSMSDTPQPPTTGKETILLVEDEPTLLDLGQIMLESLGYKVLPAKSPAEALRLAENPKQDIHLLLTDVVMPEMNGLELAKALSSKCPQIKHLFMSGYAADIIADRGISDEGGAFLHKPFMLKELSSKVREALEQ